MTVEERAAVQVEGVLLVVARAQQLGPVVRGVVEQLLHDVRVQHPELDAAWLQRGVRS